MSASSTPLNLSPRPQMNPYSWVTWVIAITLSVAAFASLASYSANFYGLFGDAKGKRYKVTGRDARFDKYLLSMNYIPANFDGLLIGTSKSVNWDTGKITAAKVYNDSLSGGNISEAKAIADNVLARRKLRVVLFLIFPYMTESAGSKSGELKPEMYWGALGSLRLYRAYIDHAALEAHLFRLDTTPDGVELFEGEDPAASLWAAGKPVHHNYVDVFKINPVAYREYGELVRSSRSNGALIVRVRPPVFKDDLQTYKNSFGKYYAEMDRLFEPSDPLIDFTTPAYDNFQNDRRNFTDGSHLTYQAGLKLVDDINKELLRLLPPSTPNAK